MNLDEAQDDEDEDDDDSELKMPDPNADKANQHRGKPLENLLMAKNRKIQDELTTFRVSDLFSHSLFLD